MWSACLDVHITRYERLEAVAALPIYSKVDWDELWVVELSHQLPHPLPFLSSVIILCGQNGRQRLNPQPASQCGDDRKRSALPVEFIIASRIVIHIYFLYTQSDLCMARVRVKCSDSAMYTGVVRSETAIHNV